METLIITSNCNEAIDFPGHIEIAPNLGKASFREIKAKGSIIVGFGTDIEAGEGIKAGTDIKAGRGIEAGEGIKAGFDISVNLRIFAGLISWRKPTEKELQIQCRRLIRGEIAYGNLIESKKAL